LLLFPKLFPDNYLYSICVYHYKSRHDRKCKGGSIQVICKY
jgi:hypothetical protein